MRAVLSFAEGDSNPSEADVRSDPDLLVLPPAACARRARAQKPRLFVLLDDFDENAVAIAASANAEGVLLPRAESMADIEHVCALLAVAEARAGLVDGALRIIACVSSGAGLLALPKLTGASPRVGALGWDAGALGADLGAQTVREADGRWIEPLAHARTRLLASAAAAGLPAIDTASEIELAAFAAEAATAWRHGFRAKFATSAAQVASIRAVTEAERA